MLHTDALSEIDQPKRLHLTGPTGAAVGLALALVLNVPLVLLSKLAGFQFLAVELGFVGAIYFGFAIADGSVKALAFEFPVSGVFLAAGAAALWADSPVLLAAGYATHALWDLVHHPRAVPTPVHSWYPPFCVVFDVVVAAFIL